MASIRKRGNSYQIEVFDGSDDNKNPIRRTFTYHPKETAPTKIKKELQAYAAEIESNIHAGLLLDGDRVTFKEVAQRWLKSYATGNMQELRREYVQKKLETYAYPAIGRIPIGKIKLIHLQGIVDDLDKKGLNPKTIRDYFSCVSQVFKAAYIWGIIQTSPCDRVMFPKQKTHFKYTIWTPEQVQFFFDALKKEYPYHYGERIRTNSSGDPYKVASYDLNVGISKMFVALFTLCIYSSARRGEICALTWEDVNMETQEITINKAVTRTKAGGQHLKDPKTQYSYRKIYVPKDCIDALMEWKQEEIYISHVLGDLWKGFYDDQFDKNFIFIQQDSGKCIDIDTVTQKFKKIIKRYNESSDDKLPEIRLHDLRHTGASLMISSNVDILTVSHRLGHSRASTTLDIYSHALPAKDKEAAETLSNLIAKQNDF